MIRLGYEVGTGRAIDIPSDRHIGISGQTQRSGKTTTLEALIRRSGKRAVAFVTKKAESGFRSAVPVPPYFSNDAGWEFVSSILEAMLNERMKFERSWIINACRGASTLQDVAHNVRDSLRGVRGKAWEDYESDLAEWNEFPKERKGKKKPKPPKREWERKPATGLNEGILTQLDAYCDKVIPQIERLPYTREMKLKPGLNVMDLSGYSTELQSLVIRSVLEWVYEKETNTVVIVPEAWEFIPQNRRSPVLLAAEELIRKGAAAGNLVWLDTQDIAAIHTSVRRSVGVWILGVQREKNEVERNLAYLPGSPRPKAEDMMQLERGQFFASWEREVIKVYVQPFWIGEAHARAIARGEEKVASAEQIWREHARTDICESPEAKALDAAIAGQALEEGETLPVITEINKEAESAVPDPHSAAIDELDDLLGTPKEWRDRHQVATEESEDEEMACTNCEKLERRILQLEDRIRLSEASGETVLRTSAAADIPPAPGNGMALLSLPRVDSGQIVTDVDYQWIKARLLRDTEVLAALEMSRPELVLQIQRPRLEWQGNTLKARIALLIHDGFFKAARPSGDVLRECQRRGWLNQNNRSNHVAIPLAELTEEGFLTKEDAGYRIAPGVKISTKEV